MTHLNDLPVEMLRRIFEYALPQGLTFSFEWQSYYVVGNDEGVRWNVLAAKSGHQWILVAGKRSRSHQSDKCKLCVGDNCKYADVADDMHYSLLYINKAFASEAQATFFAGNTFALFLNAKAHKPVSLKSPNMFGPLGLPNRLHILRDLRHIEMTIKIDDFTDYAVLRHRARLQYFVDVLREHAQDDKRKALLQSLHVRLVSQDYIRYNQLQYPDLCSKLSQRQFEKHMFTLERFSGLTDIAAVKFTGLPPWFAECLELHVRGESGDLATLAWLIKTFPRSRDEKGNPRRASSRESWQPLLDWRGFAIRNNIPLPDDVDRFFPPREDVVS